MDRAEILSWLYEQDEQSLETLWHKADAVRRENVGDEVHLRGLIEISNFCVRRCAYCGINASNTRLKRYRMSSEEILSCAHQAVALGYGTVVLQSGEDYGITLEWLAELIRAIKNETPLAVTLSLGERSADELFAWRKAGADRYFLRFETSNRTLYDQIHPPVQGKRSDRIALLRTLRQMGYEIGSGIMVGIPGQRYLDVAQDIEMFRALDLDMIGVGPYIPHPQTTLAARREITPQQVPNTELMTCKVIALSRIVCPKANIPSTTALSTVNREHGRELGLTRGANVVMPNLTPPAYRVLYEIYPGKACIFETTEQFHADLQNRIRAMGRKIGVGRGDSPRNTSPCVDAHFER